MPSAPMGIQESFRWIIRSVIVICGVSLFLVVFWQTGRWWSEKRTLGNVDQVVCLAEEGQALPEKYWKDFFSFWLLPHQAIHPYQMRCLEKTLLETGYFKATSLSLEDSNFWVRYKISPVLAHVGEGNLCLYETGVVKEALLPLDSKVIKLVGMESWADEWNFQKVAEIASFLKQLKGDPLFEGCLIDIKEWKSQKDPSSEFILCFSPENQKKIWIRLGSVHFKYPEAILEKLSKAYKIARQKSALWVDLRLESLVVLGYEEKNSEN
jgi:hypothetical protein